MRVSLASKTSGQDGKMSKDKSIRAKILVVDDERGAREALQVILEDD